MQRDSYLIPLNHKCSVENSCRTFSTSICHKNFFTEEERQYMFQWMFDGNTTVRVLRNGNVLASGRKKSNFLTGIVEKFNNKIEEILPGASKSPIVGGNFFISPEHYGPHTDSSNIDVWKKTLDDVPLKDGRRRYTPWKNILIPLWGGKKYDKDELDQDAWSNDRKCGSITFFDQRHPDFSWLYDASKTKIKRATKYRKLENYSEIQFFDKNGKKIDKSKNNISFNSDYHKHNLYGDIERYTGMTVENKFEWKPGDVMVFDSFQIHSSHSIINLLTKSGLVLWFLKELDKDLLQEWFFG